MARRRSDIKLHILNESSVKTVPLGKPVMIRCIQAALRAANMPAATCEISLYFVDDERMRELNRKHRGIDRTTDVLGFPQFASREEISPGPEGHILLGDIVISLQTLNRRCKIRRENPAREMAAYLIHAVLHLIGYDHDEKRGRAAMQAIESDIIDTISL